MKLLSMIFVAHDTITLTSPHMYVQYATTPSRARRHP